MLVAGVIEILLLINKPTFTVRGLVLVLLGVPVYFLWRGTNTKTRGDVAN
jgi:APA family basic amino acid/polyamine antiporter